MAVSPPVATSATISGANPEYLSYECGCPVEACVSRIKLDTIRWQHSIFPILTMGGSKLNRGDDNLGLSKRVLGGVITMIAEEEIIKSLETVLVPAVFGIVKGDHF